MARVVSVIPRIARNMNYLNCQFIPPNLIIQPNHLVGMSQPPYPVLTFFR